ncbi:TOPRIM nucleotidyl transferase/hydrolase domain-containing protein [Streptomyces sp. ST2-7A]|uniref:TOPRIM nucleotidyl transferase/hydrolase domain-containing protein n=1 Tax=Streptomyces sp. ST2-7A TaxID=2907214 RepID=UPI001F48A3FE|nr:TOPRIM nucleotidyl transferase/hydrolase domain-containing protein [Streptomyces sp. ST2-7A]MCE7078893.1 ATP-dependent endonuclease [Streptomyces sp. ST2-7A]
MADMRAFREAVTVRVAGGPDGAARDLAESSGVRVAVLVEGMSDLAAVEALATRHGRDLAAGGVCVVPMGGAMSVGGYAALLGSPGLGLRLVGLCDEAEQGFYERGLSRAGAPLRDIHVCGADLEDELIRALGIPGVEEIFRTEGDFRSWQTFRRQPAQHERSPHQQARRFLGTRKGRKIRYGRLLVEALVPDRTPAPLDDLLASL